MADPNPPRSSDAKLVYGFRNRVERFVLTHGKPVWKLANAVPFLDRRVNALLINRAVNKCPARPYRLSMRSDYPSWDSLTDRKYSGRHLPPADDRFMAALPKDLDAVLELYKRPDGVADRSAKSTVLFAHFAQWFTDGFLRTARLKDKDTGKDGGPDWQRNTSNHEIDLSPVYGRTPRVAAALRRDDGSGKLRSQVIPSGPGRVGGEFPPYYFDQTKFPGTPGEVPPVAAEFQPIAGELQLLSEELMLLGVNPDPKAHTPFKPVPGRMKPRFAMGVERANNQLGYVALNTLFLREHNRLCDLLRSKHPDWDGDRLYHTARNTVIAIVLKLVVEEYINHISPFHYQFRADPRPFYASKWYRTNWICLEFNLLYRWHGLVPDQMHVGDRVVPLFDTLFHNDLLIDVGIAAFLDSASRQPAGRIGLRNTAPYLVKEVELPSVKLGRAARLQGYNAYREYVGFPRVTAFDQITTDRWLQEKLTALYKHPDNLELYVGLGAEDVQFRSAVPPLAGRLVAIDAFSQALTNPLLSEHVFTRDTFAEGWEEFHKTKFLGDVVARNTPGETPAVVVSMTQKK